MSLEQIIGIDAEGAQVTIGSKLDIRLNCDIPIHNSLLEFGTALNLAIEGHLEQPKVFVSPVFQMQFQDRDYLGIFNPYLNGVKRYIELASMDEYAQKCDSSIIGQLEVAKSIFDIAERVFPMRTMIVAELGGGLSRLEEGSLSLSKQDRHALHGDIGAIRDFEASLPQAIELYTKRGEVKTKLKSKFERYLLARCNMSNILVANLEYKPTSASNCIMNLITMNAIHDDLTIASPHFGYEKHGMLIEQPELEQLIIDKDIAVHVIKEAFRNAVKYTLLTESERKLIRPSLYQTNDMVCFQLDDSGIGISGDEIGRVFESRYRSPRTAEEARGTGLGLNYLVEIVHARGGYIELMSRDGKVDGSPYKTAYVYPHGIEIKDEDIPAIYGVNTRLRIFLPRSEFESQSAI